MISALKGFSGNMANLTKVLRAELFSLVEFAEAINAQKTEKALSFLNQGTGPVKRVSFKSSSARIFFDELAAFGFPLFPNMCLNTHSPLEIIESFNRFRILSPLRKGWMGVDEINRFFACKTLSLSKEDEVAIPITISANDYRMNLFNGESGVLIRKKCQNEEFLQVHKEDYALFLDASSVDGFRKIPANLLPKHEYGYCLSVHKSQGSEFDKVLLLMPKGSEIFGKGVVYTAVTRAKKEIAVWEEDGIFGNALETLSKRQSGICARFSLMIFGKGDC
jgi:exodeoxyribonuclease V alpha subunit